MPQRVCPQCEAVLGEECHPSRRFCTQCRPPKRNIVQVAEVVDTDGPWGPLGEALEESIAAAGDQLTKKDQALVQAARFLAKKLDTEDECRDKVLRAEIEAGVKPVLPPLDNVSMPTYIKVCEALGLSVAARARIEGPKKEGKADGGKRGKLAVLRGAGTA